MRRRIYAVFFDVIVAIATIFVIFIVVASSLNRFCLNENKNHHRTIVLVAVIVVVVVVAVVVVVVVFVVVVVVPNTHLNNGCPQKKCREAIFSIIETTYNGYLFVTKIIYKELSLSEFWRYLANVKIVKITYLNGHISYEKQY